MEDILASIRRIIADDQSQANRPAAAAPRRAAPPPERTGSPAGKGERGPDYGEVLDLARMPQAAMADMRQEPAQPVRSAGAVAPDQTSYVEERNSSLAYAVSSRPVAPAPAQSQHYVNNYATPTLVRDHESGVYGSAEPAPPPFDRYAGASDHEIAHDAADASAGDDGLLSPALGTSVMSAFETLAATVVLQNSDMLDRLMRELMRPLIKTWLDENLPTLVERLVRGEIERVARGNRG